MLTIAFIAWVGATVPIELSPPLEPLAVAGGSPDVTDEFSAAVLVQPHTGGCSGVLIAESLVLTAAHCVDDLVFGQQLGVYAGPVVAEQEFLQVADYTIHPDYCPECVRDPFDIALIELREPFVPASPLPRIPETPQEWSALVFDDAPVTAVGYGLTTDDTSAAVRQVIEQRVILEDGSRHWFSASGTGSSCEGDSGGPVFARRGDEWMLVGIMARGSPSDCDGSAEMRVGSTTAALCWLTDNGLDANAPDDEFCRPDPNRMRGCGECTVHGRQDVGGWAALLLVLAIAGRKPRSRRRTGATPS